MDGCIFCKIAAGEIPSARIWEDGSFIAFLDINPINPGHTLIVPKEHVENVFAMESARYGAAFEAARRLAGPIQKAMGAKRIGMVIEGFLVSHAHIHLVPLNHGGELSFARARKATSDELAEALRRIRQQL